MIKHFSLRTFATVVAALLLILIASAVTLAQGGGKAEPNRIKFKHGASSATFNGTVRGDEQAEYVLAAKKGQKLNITLTSVPGKSTVFQIVGPENDTLGLEFDANFAFSGKLPKDGDYFITVARPGGRKGTSRYRLLVTVQ